MKSNITKRLVLTNIFVLVLALVCFNMVSIYNLKAQAKSQAEQQILAESSVILERTAKFEDSVRQFNDRFPGNRIEHPYLQSDTYIFPSQNKSVSVHVFCSYDEKTKTLTFPTDSSALYQHFDLELLASSEIPNLSFLEPEIISLNGESYLALLTPYEAENEVIVSVLAMESVDALTTANTMSFFVVMGVLILISFGLIYWQSMKITAPLHKLTEVTKLYSKQDYSTSFFVETGDEIESLSHSIQTMVESILANEKSQRALFRNLSHELKTPLSAISGYAQNIQNGCYEDTQVPLSIIEEESLRIRDILDDLIFLSKMDSYIEEFSMNSCDVVAILTDSIEKVESIAILKEVDIEYTPPKAIPILCDQDKLMRAFINLLSNALKHTKTMVEIEVICENDAVLVRISDDGEGFPPNKLEKLFLTTTGETVDGNGIGLLIVYEIIKKHGGAISVQNREVGGAEVALKLPLETGKNPEP
ncbi:MAG: HAMP domain-containing sensor histidine kinase [Eubacteriales bacterium]